MIGAAVKVMKIATGEIEEDIDGDGRRWTTYWGYVTLRTVDTEIRK